MPTFISRTKSQTDHGSGNYPDFHRKIPEEFSPESFIEMLSDEPNSYFVHDEGSKFFSSIKKKSHMAEAHEIVLSLYDNRPYRKRLTTKRGKNAQPSEWNISVPFFNVNFVSTIQATSRVVDEDEFTSGLFPRFLMYHPTYEKDWKPLGEATEENLRNVNALHCRYGEITSVISSHPPIRFRLSDNGWAIYNAWVKKRNDTLSEHQDEMAASIFSRYSVITLKLAMLFTEGSQDFVTWAKENKDSSDYKIPDEYVIEAIRQMDEYFIPVALNIRERFTEIKSNNLGSRIKRLLKEKGEMNRPDLVRHCNLYRENKSTWHFDNAMKTLNEAQEVLVRQDEKGKYYYRTNPQYQ